MNSCLLSWPVIKRVTNDFVLDIKFINQSLPCFRPQSRPQSSLIFIFGNKILLACSVISTMKFMSQRFKITFLNLKSNTKKLLIWA